MRGFIGVVVSIGISIAVGCSSHSSCSSNDDCGSDQFCEYKIGSCSTVGECFDGANKNDEAQCTIIQQFCACDGSVANTGCGFADGYASAPTLGTSQPPNPEYDVCPAPSALDASTD